MTNLGLNTGPCQICGDTNYPASFGGPTICPPCDCGIDPKIIRLKREVEKKDAEISSLRKEVERLKFLEGVELSYKRFLELLTPLSSPGETCYMTAKRLVDNLSKSQCVYCGWIGERMSDAMRSHMTKCLAHPIGIAERGLTAAGEEIKLLEADLEKERSSAAGVVEAAKHLLDTGWECHSDDIACTPELRKALDTYEEQRGKRS